MFCTKYSKSASKKPATGVKKFKNGGKVDQFDVDMQRQFNATSGANDLPFTVRNRDGSKNVGETARVRVQSFVDANDEYFEAKRQSSRVRSARGRAKKSDD